MKKSLFISQNWFVRQWWGVESWFRYTFNKYHLRLLKTAFKSRPWDNSYLYEIEQDKIREMVEYHKKTRRFVGVEDVIKQMELCISLLDIMLGKKALFHYDGHLEFVDVDEETCKKMGEEGLQEIKGDSLAYHCDVYVNTKSIGRFIKNKDLYWFYTEHPDELYVQKARALYYKIRREHDEEWWD